MNVMKTTKRNAVSFIDQSFFRNFNWHNFEAGDIVWLEDYHAKDFSHGICGVFVGGDDERIYIRSVSVRDGKILAQHDVISIKEIIRGKYSSYWQKYLEWPLCPN